MTYQKQLWRNGAAGGTALMDTRLNHMEDGLGDAHDLVAATDALARGRYPLPPTGMPLGDLTQSVRDTLNTADVTATGLSTEIGRAKGAEAANSTLAASKYLRPTAGIPAGDMSAAVQAQLTDARTPLAHLHVPSEVGLSNANNTSDSAKPVSTAQQAALDLKVNLTDSRLTDSRTPLAHAASHGAAGSDPVTPTLIGAEAAIPRGSAPVGTVATLQPNGTLALQTPAAVTPLTARPWAAGTAYAVNDVVVYAGQRWVCTAAHQSAGSGALDTSKFTLLSSERKLVRCLRTSAQDTANNTWTGCAFNYLAGDTAFFGGLYRSYYLPVLVQGWYTIDGSLQWALSTSNVRAARVERSALYSDGTPYLVESQLLGAQDSQLGSVGGNDLGPCVNGRAALYLAAGDCLSLTGLQVSGGGMQFAPANEALRMTVEWVHP